MVRSAEQRPRSRKKIAVIGLGMAGCVSAHFLSRFHDVHAFEALPEAGLHAHSVNDGKFDADLPLRAISSHYYANLFQYYAYLGIKLSSANYQNTGFDAKSGTPYFRYKNYFFGARTFPFPVFSRESLWQTILITLSFLWFVLSTPYLLVCGRLKGLSVEEHFKNRWYSNLFLFRFLVPILSVMLSCSNKQVLSYPMTLVAEFFCSRRSTLTTSWHRVTGGVREVSRRSLEGINCRYNVKVRAIRRRSSPDGKVSVFLAGEKVPLLFDEVVLAVEANVAKHLLDSPSLEDIALFESVSSFTADAYAHTDVSQMPKMSKDWSGVTYATFDDDPRTSSDFPPRNATLCTAQMNHFSFNPDGSCYSDQYERSRAKGKPELLLETWNPYQPPPPELTVKKVTMTRAVWDVPGHERFAKLGPEVQGRGGVWIAGSYASHGVTLLEQACTSGLEVALDLGCELPFELKPCCEIFKISVFVGFLLKFVTDVLDLFWSRLLQPVLKMIKG